MNSGDGQKAGAIASCWLYRLTIIVSLFLTLLLVAASGGNAVERKKKILVLHSYHQGLEWTDNITRGIRSVFDPLHKFYEIHFEYLDTKRNGGKSYALEVSRFVSHKNRNISYEAIIVADNNALQLLDEKVLTFQGNPPVIFCGINNYDASLTEHLEKVTGIAETTDIEGTLDLMIELHPDLHHLLVVLDRTTTGNAIREEFRKIEKNYIGTLNFEFLRDFVLDEIPEILTRRNHYDIIYILTFNRDRKGNFISYSEGIEIFSSGSKLPIYGSWDFYLGKGIVGGKITSGYLQGAEAAKTALRIVKGYDIKKIDVLLKSPTQYMFDYDVLHRFDIDIGKLPQESRVINAPPTILEKYRALLLIITAGAVIIALLLVWKYLHQMNLLKEKKALTAELEKRVQERTRELELANQKLKQLSNIDGLTQLHNRRYFDKILLDEINRSQRSSSPLSLLICDIDHFKKYNDTYGHLAGDDCIKIVAETLKSCCSRGSDCVARYGGEEFAVILPDTPLESARQLGEFIRKRIGEKEIPHKTADFSQIVSISIGVASLIPVMTTTPSTLISMADKALYGSKAAGRNRVTIFSEFL